MTKVIGLAIVFAAALSAQSYSGFADVTNCSQIGGWAGTRRSRTTPSSVDVYDNGVLLVSPPANIFRQDLLNAGIGNGYHGYSIAMPSPLKDGHSHYITIYFHGASNQLSGAGTSTTIACPGSGPGYQYYYTDALTSVNTTTGPRTASARRARPATLPATPTAARSSPRSRSPTAAATTKSK